MANCALLLNNGASLLLLNDGVSHLFLNDNTCAALDGSTIAWPQTLPQTFRRDTYQEELTRNIIVDPFEVGPAGLRRRITKNVWLVSGEMFMTTEQWEELQAFIANEILERSLCFSFPSQGIPVGSSPEEWLVLMDKPPSRTWLAEDFWLVTISFVVVPQ